MTNGKLFFLLGSSIFYHIIIYIYIDKFEYREKSFAVGDKNHVLFLIWISDEIFCWGFCNILLMYVVMAACSKQEKKVSLYLNF